MTQQDLYLVIGLILVAFAIPSVLGAYADRRAPWAGAVVIVAGGALVLLAVSQQGFTLEDVPHAFVRVVAHLIR